MKKAELLLGDSLEIMRSMNPESFDCIIVDPPYHLSNGGISCRNGKRVSVDKGDWDKSQGAEANFEFHKAWLAECQRLLKPNGTIWVFGTYHNIHACGYAMQVLGYKIINEIAWFKSNAAPNISCRAFTASHESLIWAKKNDKSKHTFNYLSMKVGDFPEDEYKNPGKQMRSIWSIPTPGQKEKSHGKHPTQKPVKVLERMILASTHVGDQILDPFMGSGTTGVAALSLDRKFTGIEREASFFNLAIKRIEQVIEEVGANKRESLIVKSTLEQHQDVCD